MPKPPTSRLLLGAVLAVVLVGCAKEVKPPQQIGPRSSTVSVTETATATSSVTPSVAATAWTTPALAKPTLPEIANLDTGAGAEAFTRYWYDQLNYAVATGDTSGLTELSHPKCVECLDLIDQINAIYSDGGHQEGNVFTIDILDAPDPDDRGISIVRVIQFKAASIEYNGDGRPEPEVPANERRLGLITVFIDGRWFVGGIGE